MNQIFQSKDIEWLKEYKISTHINAHFRSKDTHRLKVRGWGKVFHTNGNEQKARAEILISDKIDFKTKTETRDKKKDIT